jgi:hypothetical protein
MAWTLAQIDAAIDQLQTALAKGERSVTLTWDTRSSGVTYDTKSEILKGLEYFKAQRATATSRPRQWAVYSDKGLVP